jgi:hypothetical protein
LIAVLNSGYHNYFLISCLQFLNVIIFTFSHELFYFQVSTQRSFYSNATTNCIHILKSTLVPLTLFQESNNTKSVRYSSRAYLFKALKHHYPTQSSNQIKSNQIRLLRAETTITSHEYTIFPSSYSTRYPHVVIDLPNILSLHFSFTGSIQFYAGTFHDTFKYNNTTLCERDYETCMTR